MRAGASRRHAIAIASKGDSSLPRQILFATDFSEEPLPTMPDAISLGGTGGSKEPSRTRLLHKRYDIRWGADPRIIYSQCQMKRGNTPNSCGICSRGARPVPASALVRVGAAGLDGDTV